MIGADARLYGATLTTGTAIEHEITDGAHIYMVGSGGLIRVNGELVEVGDSLAIAGVSSLQIQALDRAEFVFVEAFQRND